MVESGKRDEIHTAGLRFIEQFCQIIHSADFSAVSAGEWNLAVRDSFMFTLPVRIQWHCYDRTLLGAFLNQHPRLKAFAPTFADHILIFRQGSSVVSQKRWMFQEKVPQAVPQGCEHFSSLPTALYNRESTGALLAQIGRGREVQ